MSRIPTTPTTTDALKLLGLALILFDHIGHFLAGGQDWMRVLGRWGVPIFFFLLGFARSRNVPMRWIVLGILLTAIDILWTGHWSRANINILINLALLRAAGPWLLRQVRAGDLQLWALVGLLVGLVIPSGWISEYGSCGWLLALVGVLHREAVDAGSPASAGHFARRRDAVALVAGTCFVAAEQMDYEFEPALLILFAAGTLAMLLVFRQFRRVDLAIGFSSGVATILRFCGRYSLEIYAAQIILLAACGALWSFEGPDGQSHDGHNQDDD